MLDRLTAQPPDALLALIKMYAEDSRADKIDLGVGVYRTDEGATPVFAAIKGAERQLLDTQDSKSYLGPEGDPGFVHALKPYVFGSDATRGGRIAGMQTPGGTGAVRLALALAKQAGAQRVHMGVPSWPNHAQIAHDLDLEIVAFDHALPDGSANVDAATSAIADANTGDAVLLHACCHNPTGVDYTPDQWDAIADAFAASAALPIIDSAYQGLGEGMEEDAYGLRRIADTVDQALFCYSCDKNFGLYRDRVGALYVLAKSLDDLPAIMSNANALARANWSMPPDHGGAAVRMLLRDTELTAQWREELEAMRQRLRWVRETLALSDNQVPALHLTRLATQNGMFAILPLEKAQIDALREEHAVYMAGSGRINVAGLTTGNIERFVEALADVTA